MFRRYFTPLLLAPLGAAACRPSADERRSSPPGPPGAELSAAPAPASADAFVRAFYAAYAPRGQASGLAATDSLLRERPALFAPPLLALLRRDAAARGAAVGEIDGLDFDPFLSSQDPCDRYEVGGATRAGASVPGGVRVSVRAVCAGGGSPQPTVTAEVAPASGGGTSWQFVNFYYGPPAGDLLALLRRLHPPAA
jgi:hypothetical protein